MGRRLVVLAGAGLLLVAVPQAAARAPSVVTGPTTSVGAATAVVTGKVDHIAEQAFFNVGSMEDVERRWSELQKES